MLREGCVLCFISVDFPVCDMFVNTTSPTYKKVVTGEGMPLTHDPSQRGNLILTFDIQFPVKLSTERKQLIKQALASNKYWLHFKACFALVNDYCGYICSIKKRNTMQFVKLYSEIRCTAGPTGVCKQVDWSRSNLWQEIMITGCLWICGLPPSEPVSAARMWRTSPHSRSPAVRRMAWTSRRKTNRKTNIIHYIKNCDTHLVDRFYCIL